MPKKNQINNTKEVTKKKKTVNKTNQQSVIISSLKFILQYLL